MDTDFVNLFIEKLTARVETLTKNEIIYQVQLDLVKKNMANLSAENDDLKQRIYKLEGNLNKKAQKAKDEPRDDF